LLAGGDWMPGFRLFAPLLPLALGCARPAQRARHVLSRMSVPRCFC
jgi:hypothetical protein